MKSRSDWIKELSAQCPKRAAVEVRAAFAETVLSRLASTAPHAVRVQGEREINERVGTAVSSTREGIQSLRIRIERDPVGASGLGLRGIDLEEAAAPLEALLDRVQEELKRRDKSLPTRTRGRQIDGAVEIAAMIAREYQSHFKKLPGSSKQEASNNPFAAICRVVERILKDAGYRVTIGYDVRAKVLGRYTKKIAH